jgi:hypothetical protein
MARLDQHSSRPDMPPTELSRICELEASSLQPFPAGRSAADGVVLQLFAPHSSPANSVHMFCLEDKVIHRRFDIEHIEVTRHSEGNKQPTQFGMGLE